VHQLDSKTKLSKHTTSTSYRCLALVLTRRKKELYRELRAAEKQTTRIVQSTVARSTINGGDMKFVRG
jgi:hypothetical protein